MNASQRIQGLLNSSEIFLFMKGTPQAPMCRFSAQVVSILEQLGATYETFDILKDPDLRQGVKEFSQWPTYPQLYVKGQLIGGCDVVSELSASGELESLLQGS